MAKRKKIRIKRVFLFIIFLFFLIIQLIIIHFRAHNYKIIYKVDNCLVTEKYTKKEDVYKVSIVIDDISFDYVTNDDYTKEKQLVKKIKVKQIDDYLCIYPKSDKLSLYNLCYKDKEYISTTFVNKDDNNNYHKYNNYYIYDLNDAKYLLWNYDKFIYLNNDEEKKIKISKKDIYSLKNAYQTDRYLFVPEQNKYSYKKAYIIDANNGKLKDIKFNNELYYDSYYLGYYKNNIYLVDNKNKQEYEIDLKNEHINKIKGKILKNGKWENIPINKLLKKEYSFIEEKEIIYSLKDNRLYAKVNNTNVLIDYNVDAIIKDNNYYVYYLKKDSLYYYNFYKGNKLIMKYSEWKFNNKNMIFVFD